MEQGVDYLLHNLLVVLSIEFDSDKDNAHVYTIREHIFTELATIVWAWDHPEDNYLSQCPRCGRNEISLKEVFYGKVLSGEDMNEGTKIVSGSDLGYDEFELAVMAGAFDDEVKDIIVGCEQCKWSGRLDSIVLS